MYTKQTAYRMRDIVPTNPQQNGSSNVTQIFIDRHNQMLGQSTQKLLGNSNGLAAAAQIPSSQYPSSGSITESKLINNLSIKGTRAQQVMMNEAVGGIHNAVGQMNLPLATF